MNTDNNYTTITVAVLFFLATFSCSQASDIMNDTKSIVSSVADTVKSVVPDCIFGVKSVSYVLRTRSIPGGKVVHMQDRQIPIRHGAPIVFFVHGFVSEANGSNYVELMNIWLQKADINIFSVDWDKAACNGGLSLTNYLAYGSAVQNVPVVGENVAKFIQKLAQSFRVKIQQITIIGHSLGAHVAGHAGKAVQRLTRQKCKMIFGLDPAGPLFRGNTCGKRLCVSDATYVLIYHTSKVEGYHDPLGTADYYFHGGTRQPGCKGISIRCDHARAVTYASMSIRNQHCFLGTRWQLDSGNILSTRQCNPSSCAYAGLNAPQENAHGIYYVDPSSESPFCNA